MKTRNGHPGSFDPPWCFQMVHAPQFSFFVFLTIAL
uniref:Uncharacterized protein n=1 Tax=Anguilla anguilla TaxID=7936 RepID=A0A0E9VGP4_ANGAN